MLNHYATIASLKNLSSNIVFLGACGSFCTQIFATKLVRQVFYHCPTAAVLQKVNFKDCDFL